MLLPLIGSLINGVFSLASNRSQWNQQQRALAAQKKENEKMREYNMQLAQQQNQWNLEQWNRENAARKQAIVDERAYNSPSAQKARLEAAGLNPDMMYGQGGVQNTSAAASVASSPEMTAGAPATPMDWSSLANRPTIYDGIMKSLSIRQAEANISKTESETEGLDIDNEYKPLEKALGLELTQSEIDKNRATINHLNADIKRIQSATLNLDQDTANKALEHVFNSKGMQLRLRSLAAKTDMDEANAQVALKTVMYRTTIQQNLAAKSQFEANEAEYKAAIAKFQSNAQWYHEFLKLWEMGIRSFDSYLQFKGWITDVDEWLDGPDGPSHRETRTHRHH